MLTPEYAMLKGDATNAFNLADRSAMLFTVRHLWPKGALFAFNCYKHCSLLIIHNDHGELCFFYSDTGVTQGCPLAMILYGLLLLPLIRKLKQAFPSLIHLWFADDGNAIGTLTQLKFFWAALCKYGPAYGYHPDPSESIIITTVANLDRANELFLPLKFQIVHGDRFLGGYIGNDESFSEWLEAKVHNWGECLGKLALACPAFPQAAYCGLQKSLQMEWQFVQRVTPCAPTAFDALELLLAKSVIPALFGSVDVPCYREITSLPTKLAGLSLPDPTATCASNLKASQLVTAEIISALTGTKVFSLAEHSDTVSSARAAHKTKSLKEKRESLQAHLVTLHSDHERRLRRACSNGRFLTICPSYAANTVLSAEEFRDRLCYRYGQTPSNLPTNCDGCGCPFSVDHAMSCKKGGLVICRHDEFKHDVRDIYQLAAGKGSARDEPRIFIRPPAAPATAPPAAPPPDPPEPPVAPPQDRGDVLLRNLFERGTDCIIDVRIVDLNAASYRSRDPLKVMKGLEREKKKHYLKACKAQRRHFAPFVVSTCGLLAPEAKAVCNAIAEKLADKWQQPKSVVRSYISARLSITLARACHMCLRGSRTPASKMSFPTSLGAFSGSSSPPGDFFLCGS